MTPLLRHLVLLCCLGAPILASAAVVAGEHVESELISENTALVPGRTNWLALRLKTEPGWHTYWRNPGDAGIPTTLRWTLPEGFSTGDILWPYPEQHALGEVMNYGYEGQTLHLVPLSLPADFPADGKSADLKAQAKWLVCADICIPGSAQLSLSLPVAATAEADSRWAGAFAETRAHLPLTVGWSAQFSTVAPDFSLSVSAPELATAKSVSFFPYAKDLVNHAAAARSVHEGATIRLSQNLSSFFLEAPVQAEGVLVVHRGDGTRAYEIAATPGTVQPIAPSATTPATAVDAPATPGLPVILLFALIGGLILNLMPCVFPVLSLKALSVMESRGSDARAQALAYTAGVVASFLVVAGALMALRAGGQALGWGFQLQSPVFIAALAYLFFAMGLALAGVAELGTRWMGVGQSLTQSHGLAGSFFTGVLATVVASPCTAPFMGSALGYALTQPAAISLLVFATLGLGLALPFVLIGFFPRLASWLPKPGAWMETFKQLMAFPLFLTVVWLLWILTRQSGANAAALAMLGMVLLALALWLQRRTSLMAKLFRWAAIVAALALLAQPALRADSNAPLPMAADATGVYSDARLAELLAQKQTVFVNFTADWCLTCKANERAVLKREATQALFREKQVTVLTGDWTRPDPAITAALARFGRSGVPLYLLYVRGGEPQVLPQILTREILADALNAN